MPIAPTVALPAPTSWDELEKLIAELCIREWRTPAVSRYGRQGQAQHGVDIFGYPEGDKARLICVQCKCVATFTPQDALAAIDEARAFRPVPAEFWIATTARSDAGLQAQVLSRQDDWPFLVHVRSWDDLQLAITRFPDLVDQFWPTLSATRTSIARIRDVILDSEPTSFKKVFADAEVRYVHEHDVNLAIVVPDERCGSFDEEWIELFPANANPPKPASVACVHITYAGKALATFKFLYLDGSRYLLPLPPAPAHEVRVIDAMEAALGRIVGQGVAHSFEEGIERARMRVVEAHHDSQTEWLR